MKSSFAASTGSENNSACADPRFLWCKFSHPDKKRPVLILTRKPMATTCLPPVCRPLVRLAAIALSLLALSPLIGWAGAARAASDKPAAAASFAEFDRRARAGEELTVVFFGASLTWGANATDQALSSYRAHTKDLLEARYPKARFRCYDAAIGGTGSQLGAFRLERDVLVRTPDLVFLDFSANDDNWNGTPLALASYESLLRRIIRDGRAPVVAVMFPFKWELGPGLESGTTTHLKGLSRRKEIAAAYAAPAADAAALIIDRVRKGEATPEQIWDTDGVHPGDLGYRLFAEAAFAGFEQGVRDEAVCAIPEKPLSDGPFMTVRRAVLAELFPAGGLPAGWAVGKPHLTAACHDQMMSRWLDRLLIASNRTRVKDAAGKEEAVPQEPARLRFEVRASYVMVFGEATTTSGKYRVFIDGKPHTYTPHGAKEPTDLYDMTSARFNGNWNYHQMIVENLDPNVAHVLEIEPVLAAAAEQELRIESLCVAGGAAEITPLPPRAPAAGTFRETKRCGDIVCLESGERVVIANSRLRLEFDRANGAWEAFLADGVSGSLVARNEPGIAMDVRVDQEWMVERRVERAATLQRNLQRSLATWLKGIAERMPFYREIGFNTISMLPHWLGGKASLALANPQTGAAVSAAAEGKSTHIAIAPFEVLVGRP